MVMEVMVAVVKLLMPNVKLFGALQTSKNNIIFTTHCFGDEW